MTLEIRILGSGDAIGTPKVGCTCPQCREAYRTGRERLRTSLLVTTSGHTILVESGPDLRRQLLAAGSPRIDAVIWSHGHYDHFMGFGEFYRVQRAPPVYAPPPVLEYCAGIFGFIPFSGHPVPPLTPFDLFGTTFTFCEVNHPKTYTCGLVIERGGVKVVYSSDTRADIPPQSRSLFSSADLLLVDAIVPAGFHINKHMNSVEADRFARETGAKEWRFVHQSHYIPWDMLHSGRDGELFSFAGDGRLQVSLPADREEAGPADLPLEPTGKGNGYHGSHTL